MSENIHGICGECRDPVNDGIGSHPKSRDRACSEQMYKSGKAIRKHKSIFSY